MAAHLTTSTTQHAILQLITDYTGQPPILVYLLVHLHWRCLVGQSLTSDSHYTLTALSMPDSHEWHALSDHRPSPDAP